MPVSGNMAIRAAVAFVMSGQAEPVLPSLVTKEQIFLGAVDSPHDH